MELNHTTEDLNFKLEQSEPWGFETNSPNLALFKLTKDRNNFFTKYERIKQADAIAKNENIIATHVIYTNGNDLYFNLVRVIKIPKKPKFQLILNPDGSVIDSRKIKIKENERIEIDTRDQVITIYIKAKNSYKATRIIEIHLD